MSSCLIITQGEKMYIGADTACSVKTKDGYKRVSNNMPKLFTLGNSIFFCSGKKTDAEKCVNWIYDNFKEQIDVSKLEYYLKDNFTKLNEDNVFNIEFLLCNYNNHRVIQLSQYNNFKPIIYDYSEELRILCGGYKTKDSFLMTKKNIALKESVYSIYKNVFEDIADECVGGNVVICSSPTSYEICEIEENNIKYANEDDLFLLTSDFVTSGVVNGSQIIGGDIYSTNYSSTTGTHMNLLDGSCNLGHKIIYDAPSNKMTMKGVDIEWSSSTTPKIGDIDGLSNTLSTQSASITANSNAITAEVKRAKGEEESLSSSIIQTADSIKSEVSATYETKGDATSKYNILSSSIIQTADSIESKVSKTDYNGKEVVSLINQTAEAVSINANKINLNGAVTANNYFKINTDGSMESISGKIGGWTIAKTYIGASVDGKGSIYITSPEDSNYWIRTHNAANGGGTRTFSVSKAGQLYARGADIEGKITADDGEIGGWTINSTAIYTGTGVTSNSNGAVAMSSADFTRTINGTSRSGLRFAIGSNFGVTNAGKIYANGAEISGKLTAGSGSRLGSGSFIGSEGAGWKITNNQIHTVKTVSNSDTSPLMTLSAGSTAEDTFIIAPYCFQIGGKFTYGDVPSGEIIGANFTRKVYITGGLKVTNGDCVISGNCNITGAATANNLTITGGTIKISNDSTGDAFQVTSNGYTHIKKGVLGNGTLGLYVIDKGIETQSENNRIFTILGQPITDTAGKVFYAIISVYDSNKHAYVYEAGITKDGWRTFAN